jgi:hypothetical protein
MEFNELLGGWFIRELEKVLDIVVALSGPSCFSNDSDVPAWQGLPPLTAPQEMNRREPARMVRRSGISLAAEVVTLPPTEA